MHGNTFSLCVSAPVAGAKTASRFASNRSHPRVTDEGSTSAAAKVLARIRSLRHWKNLSGLKENIVGIGERYKLTWCRWQRKMSGLWQLKCHGAWAAALRERPATKAYSHESFQPGS